MLKNKTRNFIIILIIAFVIMYISFRNDYENIIDLFSSMNYLWMIVGLCAVWLYQLLEANYIRYYCRYHKKNYSFIDALRVQQTGTFVNSITPSSSGGQFATIYMLSKQGINSKVSTSMIMLSFISWQTILVIFSALVLIFNYFKMASMYSGIINLVFIGFAVDSVVIVGLFLMAFSKKFHSFIFNIGIPLLGKMRIVKNVDEKKYATEVWLTLFRDEFAHVLVHKDIMFRRIITDVVKLLIIYSVPFIASLALNVGVGFDKLWFTIVASSFVYMASSFVPLPGASGGAEGMFVILFGPIFGVATTAVMLLWRFTTYYFPMFLGFGFFASNKIDNDDTKSKDDGNIIDEENKELEEEAAEEINESNEEKDGIDFAHKNLEIKE